MKPGAPQPDARKSWTPPRTPWGDPDVSGYFTNKDEQGVPFERPAEFAGRHTITDEEFAAREQRIRQQLQTDNAEFDIATADTRNAGAVGSATSPPPHWLDRPKPNRRTLDDCRSGGRPNPAANARGSEARGGAGGGADAGEGADGVPPIRMSIAACTTAASRAACPAR